MRVVCILVAWCCVLLSSFSDARREAFRSATVGGRASMAPNTATVTTALGDLVGRVVSDPISGEPTVDEFLGIPYAEPPTGELRFAPAQPVTHLQAPFMATAYKPSCLQDPRGNCTEKGTKGPAPSEDCLYLNVWRKHTAEEAAPPALKPVMVWIYGGGFIGGCSSENWFNGADLAEAEDVVVVNLNYRLSVLGFLSSDELARDYGASGGLNGIRDQIAALEWVQAHIVSFGGDPRQVTVFGESSGGMSVCVLNASPRAKGLFKYAIQQSGPCIVPAEKGWGPGSGLFGRHMSAQVMKLANASTVAGLRGVGSAALVWDPDTTSDDSRFPGYFVDDFVLPASPPVEDIYSAGHVNSEATLIMTTTKDGTVAFYSDYCPNLTVARYDEGRYEEAVRQYYKDADTAAAVLAAYPLGAYAGSVPSAFVQGDADNTVICPSLRQARLLSASHPVYVAAFAHFAPACDNSITLGLVNSSTPAAVTQGWASHGSDVHFTFHSTHGPGPESNDEARCPFTPQEAHLSQQMMAMWATFARTGRPSGAWPEYLHGNTTRVMVMKVADQGGVHVVDDYKVEECKLWDRLQATDLDDMWRKAAPHVIEVM